MVKIDPLTHGFGALPGMRRLSPRKGRRAVSENGDHAEGNIPDDIMPLVERIATSGKALQNDPTGTHLDVYRSAVRQFLDAAVAQSMQVNSECTFGLSQKIFSTIARIDVALADLADMVLGNQQDVLKIKGIVDQIKGLVVDLYR